MAGNHSRKSFDFYHFDASKLTCGYRSSEVLERSMVVLVSKEIFSDILRCGMIRYHWYHWNLADPSRDPYRWFRSWKFQLEIPGTAWNTRYSCEYILATKICMWWFSISLVNSRTKSLPKNETHKVYKSPKLCKYLQKGYHFRIFDFVNNYIFWQRILLWQKLKVFMSHLLWGWQRAAQIITKYLLNIMILSRVPSVDP